MLKIKRFGILMVVFLLLTACGSNDVEGNVEQYESGGVTEKMELTDDYAEDALSVNMQLVIGSLLLEDIDLAIDSDLASTLLPYWKLFISLSESDTTAPEELDALVNEIQEIMTVDQVNYIAGLQLTQEDMTTQIEILGIVDNIRPEGLEEGAAGGQGGLGGRGGLPDGELPEGMDPELIATMQAEKEAAGEGQSSRMITPLLEALISLLEEKAGS